MLDQGTASLQTAWRDGWAFGAFSTCAPEPIHAICAAAAATRQAVIHQAGSNTLRHPGREAPVAQALDVTSDDLRSADLTAVLGTASQALQEVVETEICAS